MAEAGKKLRRCRVVDCTDEHQCMFLVPPSEPLRSRWMDFIFAGSAETELPKAVHVCAQHFTDDCFTNKGEYEAGFNSRLRIMRGSVPTIRSLKIKEEPGSPSRAPSPPRLPSFVDAACQTEPLDRRSVATQLSLKTLQPHYRSAGVQATVARSNVGVGTFHSQSTPPAQRPSKRPRLDSGEEPELEEDDDAFEDSCETADSEEKDPTYDPAESVREWTEPIDLPEEASSPVHKGKKYLVYESCLMELFEVCAACSGACRLKTAKLGTFLSVEQRCPRCQLCRRWRSQPLHGSTPAANLQLSAAVYLTGASFASVARVCKAMQLQWCDYSTFRRHAASYIEPAVAHHWKTTQGARLQRLRKDHRLLLGGTIRAHSPGNSAKLGSYATMDLDTNTVLDVQLVLSGEAGGGSLMEEEEEGLRRSVSSLEASGVSVGCVVTRPHPQIHHYLRDKGITHYYDVRHVAKGISKRLERISKRKGCHQLKRWTRSIQDHVRWTAAGSRSPPDRIAKWMSFLSHVRGLHHQRHDPLSPQCLHDPHHHQHHNKWLQAGTPVFRELEKVVANKRTLEDVARLSPHQQPTPSWEAFHALLARFAPNNVSFSFIGRLCRVYLAAMCYNQHREAREGGPPLKPPLQSKAKRAGRSAARPPRNTRLTFRYVSDLMELIFEKVVVDPEPYTEALLAITVPHRSTALWQHQEQHHL